MRACVRDPLLPCLLFYTHPLVIRCGTYYPAASFYYGGSARANFGPDFRFPPKVPPSNGGESAGVAAVTAMAAGGTAAGCFKYRPVSEIAAEEQVWR